MKSSSYSNKVRFSLSLVPLLSAIISISLFAVGVAGYRCFLIYAMMMIVIAMGTYMQVSTTIFKTVMVFGFIVSAYYDLTNGPLITSSNNINLIVAIFMYFIIEILLNKYIKRFIEIYSDQKVFSLCPNCMFDSNYVTTKCSQCGFDSNEGAPIHNYKNISNQGILAIVQLHDDECIKMIVKTGGLLATNTIYENDLKIFASHLIITDKRIMIARIRNFKRGWSYRKSIQISTVKSAIIEPKKYFGKSMNSIKIELIDGSFLNIYFVRFGNNNRENSELLNYLNEAQNVHL